MHVHVCVHVYVHVYVHMLASACSHLKLNESLENFRAFKLNKNLYYFHLMLQQT